MPRVSDREFSSKELILALGTEFILGKMDSNL